MVVAAVGPGAGDWSIGEEVLTHPLPLVYQGTWSPSLIVRAELLARKPAHVSWAHAAAFPVPALTAVQVLDDVLRAKSGETLLVNGTGGVTGGLIVSLGVLRGVAVLATAGPSSREHVLRAGSTTVVDCHDPDWPGQVETCFSLLAVGDRYRVKAGTRTTSAASRRTPPPLSAWRRSRVTPHLPVRGSLSVFGHRTRLLRIARSYSATLALALGWLGSRGAPSGRPSSCAKVQVGRREDWAEDEERE